MNNWWKKVRSWWATKRPRRTEEDLIDIEPEKQEEEARAGRFAGLARLRPGSRRDQQLADLQAGYEEVVGLVRSIRGHLETQNRTQAELREGMARFSRTLEMMDETNRESAETMKRLMERSERHLLAAFGVLAVLLLAALGTALHLGATLRQARGLPDAPALEAPVQPPPAPPPAPELLPDEPAEPGPGDDGDAPISDDGAADDSGAAAHGDWEVEPFAGMEDAGPAGDEDDF